jgi:uncharacterized protein YraI
MKIAKSVIVAAGWLALSTALAAASPALALRDLTVRSAPGGGQPVVGRIPGGRTVDVRDCGQVWCWVTWSRVSGYVLRNYLDLGGDGPGYYEPDGPPVYGPPVYGPPVYPGPYYYGPYWRPWRRW